MYLLLYIMFPFQTFPLGILSEKAEYELKKESVNTTTLNVHRLK